MISVNGATIGETDILAEMQYHPAASGKRAMADAAEALVVRQLLLQRASALAIAWTADDPVSEEGAIEELLGRELKLPAPDAAAYRRYYDRNRDKFRSQDLFEASHILYLAPRKDREARARAKAAAQRTLAVLKAEPDRFDVIARAESRCSSAGEGGRLGQIATGETAAEIDTFLHALGNGQLCPVPIETDYGVHVLLLHQRLPGRAFAFEEVSEAIAHELNGVAWARAVSGYLSLLSASADVQGIDMRKVSSRLVQ